MADGAPVRSVVVRGLEDYRILAGAKLRSDWQYRTGFVLLLLGSFFVTAIDFLGIAAIFTNTPALGGWSLEQVAFLYGMAGLCFGLADFLVGSVEAVAGLVRTGAFDRLLIRPVNALVNITASEFNFRRLGKVAQAAVVFAVALFLLDIDWTATRTIVLVASLISGTVIASSVWVITSSMAFWTVNTQEVANTFTYGGDLAISYPLHILERWIRVTLAYLVPLVFVNYLPALYVLDVETPLRFPPGLEFASPGVAVLMVLIARWVWRRGLRHYASTGS